MIVIVVCCFFFDAGGGAVGQGLEGSHGSLPGIPAPSRAHSDAPGQCPVHEPSHVR